MRIALGVEYDGSAYNGWQVQPDRPTVQQALEEALARFAGDGAPVPTIKIASNSDLASRKRVRLFAPGVGVKRKHRTGSASMGKAS